MDHGAPNNNSLSLRCTYAERPCNLTIQAYLGGATNQIQMIDGR